MATIIHRVYEQRLTVPQWLCAFAKHRSFFSVVEVAQVRKSVFIHSGAFDERLKSPRQKGLAGAAMDHQVAGATLSIVKTPA